MLDDRKVFPPRDEVLQASLEMEFNWTLKAGSTLKIQPCLHKGIPDKIITQNMPYFLPMILEGKGKCTDMLIKCICSCRRVDGEREFCSVYSKDRPSLELPLISRHGYCIMLQVATQVLIGVGRPFLKPWGHRSHLYQDKTNYI